MSKRYMIELTEEQMRVVEHFLEVHMRTLMGQDVMLVEDICEMELDLSSDDPKHKENFDKFLIKRDHIREIMRAVFRIAYGYYGVPEKKSEDGMIAECIWDAIRHARGKGRFDEVLPIGSEPVPKIEVIEK